MSNRMAIKFSVLPALECASNARPRVLPVAAGRSTSKKGAQEAAKDDHDIIGLSTRLRIATWNCAGPSNLKMRSSKELGFDILGNFCTEVKLGN